MNDLLALVEGFPFDIQQIGDQLLARDQVGGLGLDDQLIDDAAWAAGEVGAIVMTAP